jgi:hypothetical protein
LRTLNALGARGALRTGSTCRACFTGGALSALVSLRAGGTLRALWTDGALRALWTDGALGAWLCGAGGEGEAQDSQQRVTGHVRSTPQSMTKCKRVSHPCVGKAAAAAVAERAGARLISPALERKVARPTGW